VAQLTLDCFDYTMGKSLPFHTNMVGGLGCLSNTGCCHAAARILKEFEGRKGIYTGIFGVGAS